MMDFYAIDDDGDKIYLSYLIMNNERQNDNTYVFVDKKDYRDYRTSNLTVKELDKDFFWLGVEQALDVVNERFKECKKEIIDTLNAGEDYQFELDWSVIKKRQ